MPRIAGVNIPEKKQIKIALTYLYGIGDSLSEEILQGCKIDPVMDSSKLTPNDLNKIQEYIKEHNIKIEGDLRRDHMAAVKRLKLIGCYRGTRHSKGLPARGQRTKTNNRTVRGNVRRTTTSGRKAAPAPK
ncbi:MAG TPA: 30S ribosomal protein S13 [Candidatus Pacearchaeota archaeon]|nr:30S ribosomal protein S13 [Candidatus Parcubacteria bacterium]HNZ83720.1 30S ribosomal protein S13 [Candidatus Pacearchaeota archaeon]HOU45844.1 30S ribosomal protein S13 [Candidatus Pacearchaeota archaeon]HPM08370.1 30S ribosomal protein S13 [Candidatus Pacearchaeota archaeon]HQI74367.1 30S ribosomal protein S13 [Candidatus Pacearchaeota archaeon]